MIYGLLYFPYFSRPSNLTSWISGGPSVTIPHPPLPHLLSPVHPEAFNMHVGSYLKCCYQSATWIKLNNVSCVCLQDGKEFDHAWLDYWCGGWRFMRVPGSGQKGKKSHKAKSPSVCFVFVWCHWHLLHLLRAPPRWCTCVGAWRGPSLECAINQLRWKWSQSALAP